MSEIKYKLLKELPFCSVGKIGTIQDEVLQFEYDNNKDNAFYYYNDFEIPMLIEQGWIEEYKPKTQGILANELLNNYSEKYNSLTEQEQYEWIKKFCNKYEIKEK
jgi:hypothetical protein